MMMDRFLRNNNALRILALVIACILWLAVHAPQNGGASNSTGVTQTYPLPVHVEVGPGMVLTSAEPTATVKVTTSLLHVASLPADMLKAELVANAQGLKTGSQTINVAAVNMPDNVKSYAVDPPTVTVVLEKKVEEQRSVDLQIQGNPQSGYSLGDFQPGTQSVNVSGAKSAVKSVTHVVGNVDISGLNETTTKIISLEAVDSLGKPVSNVTIAPSSLSVTVPIVASTQQVALVPEITGSPAPGYAVSGIQLGIQQVAEVGLMQKDLPKSGLSVPIDVTNMSHTTSLTVQVPLLQGMTSVTPDSINVVVKIEPSATITLQQIPISVQNASSSLNVELKGAPKVNVTLSGPQSVIRKLSKNASQVHAYVDASQVESGSTTANITLRLPDFVNVVNMSQRTVPVVVN